jgi:hypothetical protein
MEGREASADPTASSRAPSTTTPRLREDSGASGGDASGLRPNKVAAAVVALAATVPSSPAMGGEQVRSIKSPNRVQP